MNNKDLKTVYLNDPYQEEKVETQFPAFLLISNEIKQGATIGVKMFHKLLDQWDTHEKSNDENELDNFSKN